MESEDELNIKKMKLMTPYVHLNKAFLINSVPTIVTQYNKQHSADVKVILGSSDTSHNGNEELIDLDDNNVLYLHKIVLSSGSPMFDAWLKNCTEINGISVLKIPENYQWMPDFFRFFYTGQFMMTTDNIADIYMVADKYLIDSLKRECEHNLRECLKIKLEKTHCQHLKPMLNINNLSDDNDIYGSPSGSVFSTYLKSRLNNQANPNIFSNITLNTDLNSNSVNNNVSPGFSNSFQSSNTRSNSRTNIFNQKVDISDNLFRKSMENFSNSHILNKLCDKCSSLPLSVSKMLAFDTLIPLSRISSSTGSDIRKLALYNLIIQLVEEIRVENYSNFISLPFDILVELLENDNLFSAEIHLFCGVKHWLSHSPHRNQDLPDQEVSRAADILLKCIRLPLMSVEELYDVEMSARASPLFSKALLEHQVHEALRYIVYHGVPKAKLEEQWSGPAFRPRIPLDIFKYI